ncbi:MAG: hypothetical protein CL677_06790, partial [Bdellovibrionaceae bacterium]|nr:hypothetical protein [Pseudobdellovibrionaceae bacterium]
MKQLWMKNKKEIGLLGLSLIMMILILDPFPKNEVTTSSPLSLSADTLIPAGYQLVAIELENALSIDSLVADNTIVDLYSRTTGKNKSQLILRNSRLVRAPRNENQFAVLITKEQTEYLLGFQGPYFAVISPYKPPQVGERPSKPKTKSPKKSVQ